LHGCDTKQRMVEIISTKGNAAVGLLIFFLRFFVVVVVVVVVVVR